MNLRVVTQTLTGMFLMSPHIAHRHEAKLLEEYANDSNRIIYREGQSFAPYFLSALTWYKFEEAFRQGLLSKKMKPYKAHLYMVFLFSSGSYPLSIDANPSAMDKFCKKLEDILISDKFASVIENVGKVFNLCFNKWIEAGNSRYAVKEKKEFTEMLQETARKTFVNKTLKIEAVGMIDRDYWEDGEILSVRIKNGKWFAFIKTDINRENVYFDSKAFNGDFKVLIPGRKVQFQYKSRSDKNGRGLSLYATKVKFL